MLDGAYHAADKNKFPKNSTTYNRPDDLERASAAEGISA